MPAKNLITVRKGSASQWAASSNILASGEPGYDLTNNLLKIGDGISLWNNLKSVVDINGPASISGSLSALSGIFSSGVQSGGVSKFSNIVVSGSYPNGNANFYGDTSVNGSLYANKDLWVKASSDAGSPSIVFVNTTSSAGVAGITCSENGSYIGIGLSGSFNSGNTARFEDYGDNSGRIVLKIDSLEAEAKYFKIKHPDPAASYSYLQYGSLESPYNGVRLTGKAELKKGIAKIQLPSYIKYLVSEQDMNVQLTNKGHHKILYVDHIDLPNNCFTVKGYRAKTGGPFEFFWSFTGIRKDVNPLIVEH